MRVKTLFWFRSDLRLSDNPGLYAAAQLGPVFPLFIFDTSEKAPCPGAASAWWLRNSLEQLSNSLGKKLNCYQGNPVEILNELIEREHFTHLFWNRCYEPASIKRDHKIKETFQAKGIICKSFGASLLWEPSQILKQDQTPYKVFTPFYRKGCLQAAPPRAPLPPPQAYEYLCDQGHDNHAIIEKALPLPQHPWHLSLAAHWEIGEIGAQKRWHSFLQKGLAGYKEGRNFPATHHVSRLSPHLHFGEISPHQLWHQLQELQGKTMIPYRDQDHFLSELGWREFSYYLLYHFPELPHKNFQSKFDHFPWEENETFLKAWQQGKTGYPIVDAGMRELWQTGYIHNRVRMIVGSFLVKNLLLHWRHGEAWFWDCLVDADLANNSASWQWIAGSGADATPYFRIFNPITQGSKFDPEGEYTKRFLPELKELPLRYLFAPWEASSHLLQEAGILLGKDYPHPIVDLSTSRNKALEAFRKLRVPATLSSSST